MSIAAGSDGSLWFTYVYRMPDESGGHYAPGIGRMSTGGEVTLTVTDLSAAGWIASDITSGPDGALWFVGGSSVGRVTTDGEVQGFPLGVGCVVTALRAGPDGNMWFAVLNSVTREWSLGRITSAGAITSYPLAAGANVSDVVAGPDGNVWLVEDAPGRVAKVSPSGVVLAEYPLAGQRAVAIERGPDGLLYVSAALDAKPGWSIVSLTTDGALGYPTAGLPDIGLGEFVFGPDGRIWFISAYAYGTGLIGVVDLQLDSTPPLVTGVPDRAPNAAGWYDAPVRIDWQAVDPAPSSGTPTDPPDTVAALEGTSTYTSDASVDPAGNAATGSATLSIDTVAPAIVYAGNAGTYAVDQTVDITCTASDATSGIASSTCADVTGLAADLGAGSHTYSASATDAAGNTGSASVTFTVAVTTTGMEQLIDQLLPGDPVAATLVASVDTIAAAPNAVAKARQLTALGKKIDALTGKKLTPAEAALLKQLAAAL
jgi:streptogramin lyase